MNRLYDEIEKFVGVLKYADVMKNIECDLSASEVILLRCIHNLSGQSENGRADVSDIIDSLSVSAQAVSKNFRGLEKKGYIERLPNKQDRRRTEVFLTDEGYGLYECFQRCVTQFSERVFSSFEEDEYNELLRLIPKLRTVYTQQISELRNADMTLNKERTAK
ncbi:MAG: MarR family transcriptional regulator [Clostridia bacterium]|nr:MarR family transcriptional regulator [Clostridia bacterium]